MKTIDVTPTWKFTVGIYMAILKDPKRKVDHKTAEEEITRLAEAMDKVNKEQEEEMKRLQAELANDLGTEMDCPKCEICGEETSEPINCLDHLECDKCFSKTGGKEIHN